MMKLAPNTLSSRMPIKKLHVAPNDFLHAASVVALADTSLRLCDHRAPAGRRTVLYDHRAEEQPSRHRQGR
jgi:acyl-coenzyme A thioesterase PaaI-like protein